MFIDQNRQKTILDHINAIMDIVFKIYFEIGIRNEKLHKKSRIYQFIRRKLGILVIFNLKNHILYRFKKVMQIVASKKIINSS